MVNVKTTITPTFLSLDAKYCFADGRKKTVSLLITEV